MTGGVTVRKGFIALLAVLLLAACSSAPADRDSAAMSPDVDYLLTSAANDFHTHSPPSPVRFRNVRSGFALEGGVRHYRVCGEFLPAPGDGKAEWLAFATIKTSAYEQWIGGQSAAFCKLPSITWDKADWSATLQTRFESLR